jgi:hypothetical protein
MQYPVFFDEVEPIVLYDPLAEFLGAACIAIDAERIG